MSIKMTCLIILLGSAASICLANQQTPQQAPVIINNNTSSSAQPQQQAAAPTCPPANQNNIYDPRVPPAGVYSTKNGDGSSNTTYTTGEKKPYITDNNCNSESQPYVVVAP